MSQWINNHAIILGVLAVLLVLIVVLRIIRIKASKSVSKDVEKNQTIESVNERPKRNDISSKSPIDRATYFLDLVGGKDNVKGLVSCKTKLKIDLNDESLASYENEDYVNAHAAGIIKHGDNKIDIIVGFDVDEVSLEFEKLLK